MTGTEALNEFERLLIPERTTAGLGVAWLRHESENLPVDMEPRARALVEQGFEAGYDAAMSRVRSILSSVQTRALRDTP